MSFQSLVFIDDFTGSVASIHAMDDTLSRYLNCNGLGADIFMDVENAFNSHRHPLQGTLFPLGPKALTALFHFIAKQVPEFSFSVRGLGGLGSGDLWSRKFAGGYIIFQAGPFEERIDYLDSAAA